MIIESENKTIESHGSSKEEGNEGERREGGRERDGGNEVQKVCDECKQKHEQQLMRVKTSI